MTGDRWTVLLYKGPDSPGRQLTVAHRTVRRTIRSVVAGFFVAVLAFGWLLWEGSARIEALGLRAENRLLTEQLGAIESSVHDLEARIRTVSKGSAALRELERLNARDLNGLQAGVVSAQLADPGRLPVWAADSVIAHTAFRILYDVESLRTAASILEEAIVAQADSLRARRDLLERTPSLLPTFGSRSSGFSSRRLHPIYDRVMPHEGLDISATRGTPILASAKGRIVRAGLVPGYGRMVEIDHGYGYVTRYGHASRLLVRVGQTVSRGERIAEVGSSGAATSPHLHYEVLVRGVPQNPERFIQTRIAP